MSAKISSNIMDDVNILGILGRRTCGTGLVFSNLYLEMK